MLAAAPYKMLPQPRSRSANLAACRRRKISLMNCRRCDACRCDVHALGNPHSESTQSCQAIAQHIAQSFSAIVQPPPLPRRELQEILSLHQCQLQKGGAALSRSKASTSPPITIPGPFWPSVRAGYRHFSGTETRHPPSPSHLVGVDAANEGGRRSSLIVERTTTENCPSGWPVRPARRVAISAQFPGLLQTPIPISR